MEAEQDAKPVSKPKLAGIIAGGLTLGGIAFVVVLFLIKALWAWTVPDLFPGAVEQGLIARSISWVAAAKLAIFVAILSGLCAGRRSG